MEISRIRVALCVTSLLMLAACNAGSDAQSAASATSTTVASEVADAVEKASRKLDKGNISVSGDNAAKAEITPSGDLLIQGKAVSITPEQRALLLDHRAHVVAIATAGMDVGVQGAGLAMKAMGEAVRSVFNADPDGIESRMEAQADGIRQAAMRLCDHMPALLASQQRLAAGLPEFAPYATMTAEHVEECRRDAAEGNEQPGHAPEAGQANVETVPAA